MASTRSSPRTILPPRHLPPRVRADWEHLEARTRAGAAGSVGSGAPDRSELPEAVRRWVAHATGGATALPSGARLSMHGEIKVGKWRPFTAQQILTPDGFVWAARAGRLPMRISGFDRCTGGTGEMRWKVAGVVPVMSAANDDIHRSAAGRLAGELMLLPGAAVGDHFAWSTRGGSATGDPGHGDPGHGGQQSCTAVVTTGPFTHEVTVRIDPDGALRSVTLPRWGDPGGGGFSEHPFGVEMAGEQAIAGIRVPLSLRAGWWFGTLRWDEGEFFRATIDAMEFL